MGEVALHHAACSECGARFRVRSLDREYACKTCGGVVRVLQEESPPGPALPTACVACHAVLPQGVRYCPECGRDVEEAEHDGAGRPAREERKAHSHDLREASKSIELVRNVLWLLAAVFGFVTVFALTDPRIAVSEVLLSVAVPLTLFLLCTTAIAQVVLHPFAWTLAIAAFWTVDLVAHVLRGRAPGLIQLLLAVCLWLAVVPTARAARLVRRHPGAYASRAFLGIVAPARRRSGRSPAARRGRGLAADRPLWRVCAGNRHAVVRRDLRVAAAEAARGFADRVHRRLEPLRRHRGGRLPGRGCAGHARPHRQGPPGSGVDAPARAPTAARGNALHPRGPRFRGAPLRRARRRSLVPLETRGDELGAGAPGTSASAARAVRGAVRGGMERRGRCPAGRLLPGVAAPSLPGLLRAADRQARLDRLPARVSRPDLRVDSRTADAWLRTKKDRFRTRWYLDDDDSWVLVTLDPPKE